MRARYCAYAMGIAEYIVATTAPAGPAAEADPVAWRAGIEAFSRTTKFLGLTVCSAQTEGAWATVHFVAALEQHGQSAPLEERSRFVCQGGRWLYDGRDGG